MPGAFPLRMLIVHHVAISCGFFSIFFLHHNDQSNIPGEPCYQKASASCGLSRKGKQCRPLGLGIHPCGGGRRWVYTQGLPWWLGGKEPSCQCRRLGFDPWIKKIPWRRKWQPTPVFLPGKSRGQRSLVGCSPWGRKSQTRLK